jgi:hypothetical protein
VEERHRRAAQGASELTGCQYACAHNLPATGHVYSSRSLHNVGSLEHFGKGLHWSTDSNSCAVSGVPCPVLVPPAWQRCQGSAGGVTSRRSGGGVVAEVGSGARGHLAYTLGDRAKSPPESEAVVAIDRRCAVRPQSRRRA